MNYITSFNSKINLSKYLLILFFCTHLVIAHDITQTSLYKNEKPLGENLKSLHLIIEQKSQELSSEAFWHYPKVTIITLLESFAVSSISAFITTLACQSRGLPSNLTTYYALKTGILTANITILLSTILKMRLHAKKSVDILASVETDFIKTLKI